MKQRNERLITVFLVLFILVFLTAVSTLLMGCSNAFIYEYTEVAGGYQISLRSNATIAGEVTIPDKHKGKDVVEIAPNGFENCYEITKIIFPSSIRKIGKNAFCECRGLISLQVGENVTAISDNAFKNCYKLVEIYNLSSLIIKKGSTDNGSIGEYALNIYTKEEGESKLIETDDNFLFYQDDNKNYLIGSTSSNSKVTLPEANSENQYEIYPYAFYGCSSIQEIIISHGATKIGEYAFGQCDSLKNISLCDSVLSIEDGAFFNCSKLSELVIPTGVDFIGDDAFENCKALLNIDFSKNINSIGNYAFKNCISLRGVIFPRSLSSVGAGLFLGCTALSNITVDDGNEQYVSTGNCLISINDKILVAGCNESKIPSDGSVLAIGKLAFSRTAIQNIVIPDSVIKIEDEAFEGCVELTSVTLGNGLMSIGKNAFNDCSKLEGVFFKNASGWAVGKSVNSTDFKRLSESGLADVRQAATLIKTTYWDYYWKRV